MGSTDKKIPDILRSEQRAILRTTNNDLVCKDCLVRYNDDVVLGNTSRCETFPDRKPIQVLLGGKCNAYVKE